MASQVAQVTRHGRFGAVDYERYLDGPVDLFRKDHGILQPVTDRRPAADGQQKGSVV